jgi:hypothetical protein
MYDHVDSTEIKWKTGKNLTKRKVTKTQKKKGKGRGKGVSQSITVEEPTESFFHFFSPDEAFAMYNGETLEEDPEDFGEYGLQEFLEADYELGLELKEKIIPHAVMWFTGESTNIEEDDEEEEDEDDDDEGHDNNAGEDSEEDEEFVPPKDQTGTAQNPECKQQ